jgi:hypothetical protein
LAPYSDSAIYCSPCSRNRRQRNRLSSTTYLSLCCHEYKTRKLFSFRLFSCSCILFKFQRDSTGFNHGHEQGGYSSNQDCFKVTSIFPTHVLDHSASSFLEETRELAVLKWSGTRMTS